VASAADPLLGRRVLSALALGPLVVAATVIGGWAFTAMVAAGTLLIAYEWHTLAAASRDARGGLYAGAVAMAATLAALLLAELHRPGAALAALLAASALAGVGARLFALPVRWSAFGVLYLGVPAVAVIWLRGGESGLLALLWLLAVVSATDIAAYLVGRSVGGPRLAPRISPGKTWSGLAGGVVAAALVGGLVVLASGGRAPLAAALAGAVLAVVSQAGDLLESRLKRLGGLKDSGRLIPGHGGVLDRVDGIMLAAPSLALWLLVAGEEHAPWL
jgi:phosphatidate cytidylyltransferase